VAENLSNDKTGSAAEAVLGSGSDMLIILVLGQATASQTGTHQLETAASLITALSRVVGTLRGVAPQVIKGSSKGSLPDAQSLGKRFFVPDSASLRAWRGLVDCVAAGMASSLQKPTAKTQEAHARLLKSAVSLSLSAEGLVGGIACMKSLLDLQAMSPMHFLAQFWRPTVGGEARTRALYLAASIAQKGEGGVTAWRPVLPLVLAAVCDGDKAVRRAAVTWLNSAAPNRGKGGSKDKAGTIPDEELCAFMDALVESSVEMAVDRTQFSTFCQAVRMPPYVPITLTQSSSTVETPNPNRAHIQTQTRTQTQTESLSLSLSLSLTKKLHILKYLDPLFLSLLSAAHSLAAWPPKPNRRMRANSPKHHRMRHRPDRSIPQTLPGPVTRRGPKGQVTDIYSGSAGAHSCVPPHRDCGDAS
jgi:hypothetical protein